MLVGFYVLAGLLVVGLFGLVIAMWTTDLPQNIWISVACVVTGFSIAAGLVPTRKPSFEDPGLRLTEHDHPELHALVREVAAATGEEPPADVYLAPDVNAAVTDTGGLFGSGRRVMIVGLPLLDVLTVGQLRAVLAHEFGHYYGGDTRIGPWFFRTYDAIGRTVANLEAAESMWQKPFELYGEFFLRRSAAIKRQQEFFADELAAKAGGKRAAIDCLEVISTAGPAFNMYWDTEMAPVLDSRARTPLLEGFRSFKAGEEISTAVAEGVKLELEQGELDPYDSHPPMRERLAALERLPDDGRGESEGDERPALSLLRDPDRAERELFVALFGEEVAGFELLGWDDVPERVIVPNWREFADVNRAALAQVQAGAIPAVVTAGGLAHFGRGLPLPEGIPPEAGPFPEEMYADMAAWALDLGLALALYDYDWTLVTALGKPIVLSKGERSIKPFGTAEALASGELTPEEWSVICEQAGIAGLPLGGAAPAETRPTAEPPPPAPPPPAPATAG
jgi:Zn-dependent protease with chaperone function